MTRTYAMAYATLVLRPADMDRSIQHSGQLSKMIGVLSYVTILGLLAATVLNRRHRDEFAAYHIRQSVGLLITALLLALIGCIPSIGWLISAAGGLLLTILWTAGLVNALGGKKEPVPIVGHLYLHWTGSM